MTCVNDQMTWTEVSLFFQTRGDYGQIWFDACLFACLFFLGLHSSFAKPMYMSPRMHTHAEERSATAGLIPWLFCYAEP